MDRKWVFVMFAAAGCLLGILVYLTGMWAWDYLSTTDFAGDFVGKPSGLWISLLAIVFAAGGTALALKNERLYELAGEVTTELSKVSWPSREETYASTIVVIVTVIVSSIFLGIFDFVWSWVARLIYG